MFMLIAFSRNIALGQNPNRDLQLRISPSVKYNITKKWEAGFNYRLTLDYDITTFRSSYFQLNSTYKFLPDWSIEAGYIYITSNTSDVHQFFAELGYDYKINKRFELKNTLKYQYRPGNTGGEGRQDALSGRYLRGKMILEYNVPKIKAVIFAGPEFIFKTGMNEFSYNRTRYHFGVEYGFPYGNKVSLGCFYEDRVNPAKEDRLVLVAKYKLDINALVKKIRKQKAKAAKAKQADSGK